MTTTSLPMNLVIAFLTPMLLAAAGGDRDQAAAISVETINAYTARNSADLLLAGEAIALGLGVLSSMGLSMAENIPISLILRLRGNAASLHRAADQCRRALARPEPSGYEAPLSAVEPRQETAETAQPPSPPPAAEAPFLDPLDFPGAPAAIQAAFAALLSDAERRIAEAGPATTADSAPATPEPAPMSEEEYYRLCRAAGATDPANDASAQIPNLPPAERIPTSMRAAALSTTASHLIG
jgi:hypothetical protein